MDREVGIRSRMRVERIGKRLVVWRRVMICGSGEVIGKRC